MILPKKNRFQNFLILTVTIDTIDNIVIKLPTPSTTKDRMKNIKNQNLCLDKADHSKGLKQEIVKRIHTTHI